MMYPLITLSDSTEIVHSEMLPDKTVRVYVEKPDENDCFHSAVCFLPQYKWDSINGFSNLEIDYYQSVIESMAHLIMEFAQKGGFENAANF